MTADTVGTGAKRPQGILTVNGLAAPPLHLRHTAGGRPSVTPGTGRHRLAAATPDDRAPGRGRAILPAHQHEASKARPQERRLRRHPCGMPAALLTAAFLGSDRASREDAAGVDLTETLRHDRVGAGLGVTDWLTSGCS
jgi:hypothetical protein